MRRQRLLRVRFSDEELDRLDRVAASRGFRTRSALIRTLVREAQPLADLLAEIPEVDQEFAAAWAERFPDPHLAEDF
jgi:Arc/MetJ-type ribon-helix-helix transcriptional regulator